MKDEIFYFFDPNIAEEIAKTGKELVYNIENQCKIKLRYNHKGKICDNRLYRIVI